MKIGKLFISLFLVLFLFSACSSAASLKLLDVNVDIVQDSHLVGAIGITEGEGKGEELVPTALFYEFTLENTSNRSVGALEVDKGIKLKIEPKEELKSVSVEVIGFNIYNPDEYDATGLGYGETVTLALEPNESAEFTLHYLLGVSEENPDVPILVPAEEELDKLRNHALDAFLVVIVEDEEIARFDLEER